MKKQNINNPAEVQQVISEKLVEIYEEGEEDSNQLNIQDDVDSYFICWCEWGRENNDDR